MRLQAIRRPGEHGHGTPEGGYHVGIADDTRVQWWRTDDLANFAAELEAGFPLRPPSKLDTAPLFLVCTHGRHDPCCALRGRPLVEALDRARPGRAWETTHLGGDRFAANVLVLPSGVLYGRVPASAASELADCADDGRLLVAHQRGRIGLPPIVQAALVYAHETLSIDKVDAFALETLERVDENTANVCLSAPFGYVNVTILAETRSPAQLTCRGVRPAAAREYRGAAITVSETRPHSAASESSEALLAARIVSHKENACQ